MVEGAKEVKDLKLDKTWFIQSREGNIKEQYFFEKKLGSGGYGAVYLAKNKQTGKWSEKTPFTVLLIFLGAKVAVKAMQKGKIADYQSFKNEISILRGLVSANTDPEYKLFSTIFRTTQISSSCMRRGKQTEYVSLLLSKFLDLVF